MATLRYKTVVLTQDVNVLNSSGETVTMTAGTKGYIDSVDTELGAIRVWIASPQTPSEDELSYIDDGETDGLGYFLFDVTQFDATQIRHYDEGALLNLPDEIIVTPSLTLLFNDITDRETIAGLPENTEGFVDVPLVAGHHQYGLVEKFLADGCFVAGSFASWCATPPYLVTPTGKFVDQPASTPSDVDIFCRNVYAYNEMVANATANGYNIVSDNWNVTTLTVAGSMENLLLGYPRTIQIVRPRPLRNGTTTSNPEEIIASFDFTIARAFVLDSETVRVDYRFMDDMARGNLNIVKIHCPIGGLLRVIKYLGKGYKISSFGLMQILSYARHHPDEIFDELMDMLKAVQDYQDECWKNGVNPRSDASQERYGSLTQEQMNITYRYMYVD